MTVPTNQPDTAPKADDRRKHLEFLQAVITRMAANSFLVKGWAVTLITVLLALGGKDANPKLGFFAAIPLAVFWGLDAYYLSLEKRYREVYDGAVNGTAEVFDMALPKLNRWKDRRFWWLYMLVNKTIWPVYGSIALLGGLVLDALHKLPWQK